MLVVVEARATLGMEHESLNQRVLGTVGATPARPVTDTVVWIELLPRVSLAVRDVVLIDSPQHAVLGVVVAMERVTMTTAHWGGAPHPPRRSATFAKRALLNTSDRRQRPRDGSIARPPHPCDVAGLLNETRRIPAVRPVPVGVMAVQQASAPVVPDTSPGWSNCCEAGASATNTRERCRQT